MEIEKPNNWQPLDPTRTFDQYQHRYGFGQLGPDGRPQPPTMVRVVEATERYKLKNMRYKKFVEDRDKPLIVDKNEPENGPCFGWARKQHQEDIQTAKDTGDLKPTGEWLPALVGKPQDKKDELNFAVQWLVDHEAQVTGYPRDGVTEKELVPRSSVLLAPQLPRIGYNEIKEHKTYLEQCQNLRLMGKSDYEIEEQLNKQMQDDNPGGELITVEEIKMYLNYQGEQAELKEKERRENITTM